MNVYAYCICNLSIIYTFRKTNSVPLGTSPSVSMRELMAEAEAEEKKQRQHKQPLKIVSPQRPSEER